VIRSIRDRIAPLAFLGCLVAGVALSTWLAVATVSAAQSPASPPSEPVATVQPPGNAAEPAAPPQLSGAAGVTDDDAWGFDDDEDEQEAETWADLLRPQLLDLSLTVAFLAIALVSFFRKSRALKYVTLALSVSYLGFVKSQMVSITDIFRLADLSFPTFRDGVTWYVFTGFTVVSTVLWGRVYCGRICAFGAFTQLMDAILPKKLRVDPPRWLERRASWIKYGLLAATLTYYLATKHFTVYRYVEPFWMYSRTADVVLWSMLGTLLLATVFVRNMYCRFLCPVGATLGIISVATVFGIKRWSECKSCKICEKTCEWGAIEGPRIIKTECVRCDDCERVYADQQKCPHWLIPVIRSRKIVEAQAAGRPVPKFIPQVD
jgi:polyferredoxin